MLMGSVAVLNTEGVAVGSDIEECTLDAPIRYGGDEGRPALVYLARTDEFELGLPGGSRGRFHAFVPTEVATLKARLEALLGSAKDLQRATAFVDTHARPSH